MLQSILAVQVGYILSSIFISHSYLNEMYYYNQIIIQDADKIHYEEKIQTGFISYFLTGSRSKKKLVAAIVV